MGAPVCNICLSDGPAACTRTPGRPLQTRAVVCSCHTAFCKPLVVTVSVRGRPPMQMQVFSTDWRNHLGPVAWQTEVQTHAGLRRQPCVTTIK